MAETIGTSYATASSLSVSIRFAASGLSNFTTGPVEGGSTPAVVEGSVAIVELLRLFGEARNIINRDAGKILRIDCEILQADIRSTREMQQNTGLPGQML